MIDFFIFILMKPVSLLLLLWTPLIASGQFKEDFSDGEFKSNPVWKGDTAYWEVSGGKLHSIFPGTAPGRHAFYISTASAAVEKTTWEFWVQLHFNTSRNNNVNVYLAADRADPACDDDHCHAAHGYFVQIGNTADDVSLFRRDSLRDVLLIDGRDGITGHANNTLKIKVTCDGHHHWTLYTDESATGLNYFQEGEATDSTYLQSAFFSIVVNQSGKSAVGKHFFDDISLQPFLPDTISPVVGEVFPEDDHHISILFSEPPEPSSVENLLNYAADGGLIMPDSATPDIQDARLIHLFFENAIQPAKTYHVTMKHIADFQGNETDTTITFIYYQPQPYEVIIDEVFPDPTPSQGLPEDEFVELKNVSPYPVNLAGWRFCDPGQCAVLPPVMLRPDSLLILCSQQAVDSFIQEGKTLGLTHFPSLNNSGDELVLYDGPGHVMHALNYSSSWYGDNTKDKGGWSLEMRDTRFPCVSDGNWTASIHSRGGSPGAENSVKSETGKRPFITLDFVQVMDSAHIAARFNMGLDSFSASQSGHYTIDGLRIDEASPAGPLFNTIQLHLAAPLQKRKIYTLRAHGLQACVAIQQGLDDEARFGLPEPPDSLDIVINEILFNPQPGGKDFVELYNHSSKVFDVSTLQLATRNSQGEIASVKMISTTPRYLLPQEYLALTEDKQDLMQRYFCKEPDNILPMIALPQYPIQEGSVVLTDNLGNGIDEVDYNDDEQSALLHQDKGVSLERVNDAGASNDLANWHSASSVAGYATPGYLNSQANVADTLKDAFGVTPGIFSPDNDGQDDEAFIHYHLPPGFTGTVLIFNGGGQLVRHLVSHAMLGTHGEIRWDGRDDKGKGLSTGVYVIYARIFSTQGVVRHFKFPVVLAKRR